MYLIEQCVYIYIYENERQNIHFLNSRGGPFQKLLSTEGKVLCWHLRIEYFQCERCPRGFQTVFAACLTLFSQILGSWMRIIGNGSSFPWRDNGMPCQTKLFQGLKQYLFFTSWEESCWTRIVAGDQWSSISVPLAEHSPWTAPIMFFMMTTISLGVMNLILAVILGCSEDQTDLGQVPSCPIMSHHPAWCLDMFRSQKWEFFSWLRTLPRQFLIFWVERYLEWQSLSQGLNDLCHLNGGPWVFPSIFASKQWVYVGTIQSSQHG